MLLDQKQEQIHVPEQSAELKTPFVISKGVKSPTGRLIKLTAGLLSILGCKLHPDRLTAHIECESESILCWWP